MPRLEPIYISQKDGQFPTECHYLAWDGFRALGHEIHFIEDRSLASVELPHDAIVVGGVPEVRRAFETLRLPYPEIEAIPEPILPYAGRRLWHSTIGLIKDLFMEDAPSPIFIRPTPEHHKRFLGTVLSAFADLLAIMHLDDHLPCLCSDVVDFRSEWRVFVYHRQVITISHYVNDPCLFPAVGIIDTMLGAWAKQPVAFALDIGITTDGRTLPVEVNDCLSLGAYGLRSYRYAQMIRDRWRELREPSNHAHPSVYPLA